MKKFTDILALVVAIALAIFVALFFGVSMMFAQDSVLDHSGSADGITAYEYKYRGDTTTIAMYPIPQGLAPKVFEYADLTTKNNCDGSVELYINALASDGTRLEGGVTLRPGRKDALESVWVWCEVPGWLEVGSAELRSETLANGEVRLVFVFTRKEFV